MEAEAKALLNLSPSPNAPQFFGPMVGTVVRKSREGCGAPLWRVHPTSQGYDAMRSRVVCRKPGCATCLPSWVRKESEAISRRLSRWHGEEVDARSRGTIKSRLESKWVNVVVWPKEPRDDPDAFRRQAKDLLDDFDGGAMIIHPAGYCDDAPTQEPHAHVLGIGSVWQDDPDGARERKERPAGTRFREEIVDGGIDRILYRALVPNNTRRTREDPEDGTVGTTGIRTPVTWVGIYSYRNAPGGAHAGVPKHSGTECRVCGEQIPYFEWEKATPPGDPEVGSDTRKLTMEEFRGWVKEEKVDRTGGGRRYVKAGY